MKFNSRLLSILALFSVGSLLTPVSANQVCEQADLTHVIDAPAATPDGAFGQAIAIDGATAYVSALRDGNGRVHKVDLATGTVLNTIESPDAAAEYFGESLALIHGNIAISARLANGLLPDVGVVYLFDGNDGTLISEFANPSPDAGDLFGTSFTAGETSIYVAAGGDDGLISDGGAIFRINMSTGALVQTIFSPAPETGAEFGASMARVGSLFAVGAPGASGGGAVYLFTLSSGDHVATLSSPGAGGEFGRALAVSGNQLLIGATSQDGTGAAYLFDAAGSLLTSYAAPAGSSQFGQSLSAFDGYVLIGANAAAFLFELNTGDLVTAINSPVGSGAQFGQALAASSPDAIIVGAPADAGAAFTYRGCASVGGFVYEDLNNNGQRDAGENGISGVEITLKLNEVGLTTILGTTQTGADGGYQFGGLAAGNYKIVESYPGGQYNDGIDTVGSQGGIVAHNDSLRFDLDPFGPLAENYNFGELPYARISGTVFRDDNGNIVLDGTDAPIGGVIVELEGTDDLNSAVALSTVTDINGYYRFLGLRPGSYAVVEQQPAAYADGGAAAGSAGGVAGLNRIDGIWLEPATNAVNYDFAEVLDGMLGSARVQGLGFWESADGQGLIECFNGGPTATGLGNWLASMFPNAYADLTGASNSAVAAYFNALFADSSAPRVEPDHLAIALSIYATTTSLGGDCGSELGLIVDEAGAGAQFFDVTEHGAAFGVGNFTPLTLKDLLVLADGQMSGGQFHADDAVARAQMGEVFRQIYLQGGGLLNASLSGYVYEDLSNDGVRDALEFGIAGVQIILKLNEAGVVTVVATTVTDAYGYYEFTGLTAGLYKMVEVGPANYRDGIDTPGSLGGTVVHNDSIQVLIGDAGGVGIGYNFGELPYAEIHGAVYFDRNVNDVMDAGDSGIGGVEITLEGVDDRDNAVIVVTTTNSIGDYKFLGLRPGVYAVTETQPLAYDEGATNVGSLGGMAGLNVIDSIPLGVGENGQDYNFGEVLLAPLAQCTVQGLLFFESAEGRSLIESLNGDANATQLSSWLAASFPALYGTDALVDLSGLTNTQVWDYFMNLFANSAAPRVEPDHLVIAISAYATDIDLAGGDYAAAYGLQVSELGTGALGYNVGIYGSAVGVDNYSVVTVMDMLVYSSDAAVNGTIYGGDAILRDHLGEIFRLMKDDGACPNQTRLSGYVYFDESNFGVKDAAELGIEGVEIVITRIDLATMPAYTVVTDANGYYAVSGMPAGTYRIEETQPAGYDDGLESIGSVGGLISGNDVMEVELAFNVDATDYNFGEVATVVGGGDETPTDTGTPEDCDTAGKPIELRFRYLGLGAIEQCLDNAAAAAGMTPVCSGDLQAGEAVSVSVNGGTLSVSQLQAGDIVKLGNGFSNNVVMTLTGADGRSESDKFHTSCSVPLEIGDRFGNLELIDFVGKQDGVQRPKKDRGDKGSKGKGGSKKG